MSEVTREQMIEFVQALREDYPPWPQSSLDRFDAILQHLQRPAPAQGVSDERLAELYEICIAEAVVSDAAPFMKEFGARFRALAGICEELQQRRQVDGAQPSEPKP